MSFFPNAHNTAISAHIVTMTTYSGPQARDRIISEGFNILLQSATPSAFYGSTAADVGNNLGCLHGTRLDVQDHIFEWLNDPDSEFAMWMYGPAGIGKTAIAQTISKSCEERHQLSSAFFFFRSDGGRNSAKHLVATLAYGILQQMPHTRDVICAPIADNPLIFATPLEHQIKTIILPAISEPFPSSQKTLPGPMLFILDGLDECSDTGTQKSIIQLLISLLAAHAATVRHKLLIVSRPESQIVSTFSTVSISRHVNHLCLDEWKSIADIEIFLRFELEEVKQTHPLKSHLDAEWPLDDLFKKLLHKSFESFAYATSAVRYISSHDRHPETSLNNLLGLNPDFAYEAHAELDSLYHYILDSLDEKTRHMVLKVFCLHICDTRERGDFETFGLILGEETFAVELAMTKMSSVVRIDRCTHRFSCYHTSFSDFLLDKQRSGTLYLCSYTVAMPIMQALVSRLWVAAETRQGRDYDVAGDITAIFRSWPVDMQIHLLNTFLSMCIPTSPVSPNDSLVEFFENINIGFQSTCSSPAIALLFPKAFEHLTAWIGSQFGPGTGTLETFLICCFPRTCWFRALPKSSHWLAYMIFRLTVYSDDPWCTIFRLARLPLVEAWEICIVLVKVYLCMPQDARLHDMIEHSNIIKKGLHTHVGMLYLTTKLIDTLQSEPARAEICYVLEEIIAGAISLSASSRRMTSQDLISLHLSQDTCKYTKALRVQEINYTYDPMAKMMDLYICKTHAEIDLPYISEDVRRLYHDSVDLYIYHRDSSVDEH